MKLCQIMFWLLISCSVAYGTEASKQILIIQSYHQGLSWTIQCEEGIRSVLDKSHTITSFYMDTKRLPEERFQEMAEKAWQVYEKKRPDLVMIGDDNGLRLLGERFGKENTPLVYFGINNNPRLYFKTNTPDNITGVLERLPVFPWLRYLKQMMPEAQKALVLMDASPTSLAIAKRVFQGRNRISAVGLTTDQKIATGWEEWQTMVNQQGWDFLLIPTFHALKDKDGRHVDTRTVVEWTCANAGVPVFSHQDYTVGDRGATGAYVIWGKTHGALAGKLAQKIIEKGQPTNTIPPVVDENGHFFFNRKNLIRFNLKLPRTIRENSIFH